MLVQIITPAAIIFNKQADIAIIPGEEGVFGVMQGHAPLIASLKPGIIEIKSAGTNSRYFINGGICKVDNAAVNIITEFGLDINNTAKDKIISKIQSLRDQISNLTEEEFINSLQRSVDTYETLLKYIS